MQRAPIVYVVPIIDTEGPKTGEGGLLGSWDSLRATMERLTHEIRGSLRDSFGKSAIYSWFILDWAGYSSGDSEFRRRGHDTRLHAVWKFYRQEILTEANLQKTGDGLYWHYHHPPKDGSWGWNNEWNDSSWHEYIIGKRMLDFLFFPAVYRAGKYVENNTNSNWLEQWIPFDFSSISPIKREFCDWSVAPATWTPYHPSVEDYQQVGSMKRLIARSLPVAARGGSGNLSEWEVEKAFVEAKEKGVAVFSFHSHDFYESVFDDFVTAQRMIERASRASGVQWRFSNALDAMRMYAEPVGEGLFFRITRNGNIVFIASNHEIFGAMPFVAVEYKNGEVRREDVVKEGNGWTFTVPDDAKRIAAGAADGYGNTDVKVLNI